MKYYLNTNGQQGGPFELSELLINGLTPQSYVWNETMTNWAPAMQVPEVAALLQQQQPAPPAFDQQPPIPPQPDPQQPQYGYQQPQYGYQQPQQPQYGYQPQPKSMDFAKQSKCASISLPTLKVALAARNFGGSNFSPTSFPL